MSSHPLFTRGLPYDTGDDRCAKERLDHHMLIHRKKRVGSLMIERGVQLRGDDIELDVEVWQDYRIGEFHRFAMVYGMHRTHMFTISDRIDAVGRNDTRCYKDIDCVRFLFPPGFPNPKVTLRTPTANGDEVAFAIKHAATTGGGGPGTMIALVETDPWMVVCTHDMIADNHRAERYEAWPTFVPITVLSVTPCNVSLRPQDVYVPGLCVGTIQPDPRHRMINFMELRLRTR